MNTKQAVMRQPVPDDGKAVHKLISECPPLDLNSLYYYLIMCTHFNKTSVISEAVGEVHGYISAYIHPRKEDTLFVWQVAVSTQVRGRGLGTGMLMDILNRAYLRNVRFIETTVTPSNYASRALFNRAAEKLETSCIESPFFTSRHFGGTGHEEEVLLRIGPFSLNQ